LRKYRSTRGKGHARNKCQKNWDWMKATHDEFSFTPCLPMLRRMDLCNKCTYFMFCFKNWILKVHSFKNKGTMQLIYWVFLRKCSAFDLRGSGRCLAKSQNIYFYIYEFY
jgi:hypothetical protein